MKSRIALLLALIMVMSVFTGCTTNSTQPGTTTPEDYDNTESADIVIIGAGAAGLSAANEAIENGAESVIILEMTNKTGGALNFTSGSMSAAQTIIQEEDGIEDTLESFVEDIIKTGSDFDGKPNRKLVELFAEEGVDTFQWLWDNGLKDYEFLTDREGKRAVFAPEHPLYSIPRTYKPKAKDPVNYKAAAHEILDKVVKDASKIQIVYNTKGTELIANDKGQVLSVIGEHLDTGKATRYDAKKGIIVATGGYSANHKLMGEFTLYGSSYLTGSPATADGNALPMMQKVGAAINNMDYVPTFPMGLESADNPGTGIIASTYTWKTGGICINKEGNRFMDETEPNNSIREVALEEQTDAIQYDIFTDKILEDLTANNAAGMYNYRFGEGTPGERTVVTASSLDELAEKIGVPEENLKKTVEDYNQAVGSKGEDEFGRKYDDTVTPFNLGANKIEGDKYYAVPLRALCIITLGGVTANENMQVLDNNGTVIPGLYAAGEVVGGIWGKFVSGGTGVMGPIVFGRIAARAAMTGELATGYTVAPSSEILDASLFQKDKVETEGFDMSVELKDGEYEATVDGQEGPMTVKVTITDGKITDVTIVSDKETASIAAPALEQIPARIVEANSPDVDGITGATLTVNRIKNAVIECLNQAK
ncbi:FAD-dependent oxidoreductase [Natronincola ferrireducens]|uniref:Urocanate reductase n=1 Tax=Natronincola ferrireducens TaxID=393762 RepID=A0A1G9FS70_9FIRM|nr:FAD-dependent oxidoreductase [Natronincola ferrireducens]SDK91264.1 fumarate reductase flavoprotein subunit [Natronincola ferrireducens]